MDEEYKYPSRYEIEQAFGEFCKRGFVNNFAQSRGIFITKAIQSELSTILAGFFFEHEDLDEIRQAAFSVYSKSTLSGFVISSDNQEFDMVASLDNLRGSIVDEKKQMKLGPVIAVHENGSDKAYRGSVNYTQKKPGRVEFLQEDARTFDFYIHPKGQGKWELLMDCNRVNDAKVMEDWVKKLTAHEAEVEVIRQDALTSSQTINFFDELTKRGMDDEWNFTQVKRITLRRPLEGGEEEETEAEPSVLSGITKAVLEGNSLRHNPFVEQCEKSGYRFTAMNYEYENKKKAHLLQIRAEFKGRPKVFEIALESYKERSGVDESLKELSLSSKEKRRLLSTFWTMAKAIFDELKSLP